MSMEKGVDSENNNDYHSKTLFFCDFLVGQFDEVKVLVEIGHKIVDFRDIILLLGNHGLYLFDSDFKQGFFFLDVRAGLRLIMKVERHSTSSGRMYIRCIADVYTVLEGLAYIVG